MQRIVMFVTVFIFAYVQIIKSLNHMSCWNIFNTYSEILKKINFVWGKEANSIAGHWVTLCSTCVSHY